MLAMPGDILRFSGPHKWLGNFDTTPLTVFGREWPSVEHAFQAAKFFGANPYRVASIIEARTPAQAKKLGGDRSYSIRQDWDLISRQVMTICVTRKFDQNPGLRAKLMETEGKMLVEGNDHGDDLWGALWLPKQEGPLHRGVVWAERHDGPDDVKVLAGRNELGRILMLVRRDFVGLTHG